MKINVFCISTFVNIVLKFFVCAPLQVAVRKAINARWITCMMTFQNNRYNQQSKNNPINRCSVSVVNVKLMIYEKFSLFCLGRKII